MTYADDIEAKGRALFDAGNGDRVVAQTLGQTRHWARTLQLKMAQERGTAIQGDLFTPLPDIALSAADYVARVTACLRRSVEGFIMAGRWLRHAKERLEHGQFGPMVEGDLGMSQSTAQRLMAIGGDPRLSNAAHVQHLPPHWGTLYELTKLSDDEFQEGIRSGRIRPDMERREIERPRAEHKPPPKVIDATPERISHPGDDAIDITPEPRPVDAVIRPEPPALPAPLPANSRVICADRVEPDDSNDMFPTAPWITRALLERVFRHLGIVLRPDMKAWEPACGHGHIAEVLREYFADVAATDLHDYGYGASGKDFMTCDDVGADLIITNPPFKDDLATDFMVRAIKLARVAVAMFLPLRYLEGVGRYEQVYLPHPPTLFAPFVERAPLHKEQWKPDGGTMTAYCWLVWIKDRRPRPPFWIPPGCRKALTKPDDEERFTSYPVIRKLHQLAPPEPRVSAMPSCPHDGGAADRSNEDRPPQDSAGDDWDRLVGPMPAHLVRANTGGKP